MSFERHASYSEFRQACRAYAPSQLLPYLGRYMARAFGVEELGMEKLRRTPPWGAAAIARENILWGNEYRSKVVDDRAVAKLFNLLRDVYDLPENASLARILTPLLQEQGDYHAPPKGVLTRVVALLGSDWAGQPELDWTAVFGMDLPRMARATLMLWMIAVGQGGKVDLQELFRPGNERIEVDFVPRDELEIALQYLTRTLEEHREDANRAGSLKLSSGQYSYNPLRTAPFVDLGGRGGVVAPEPRLIHRALSVANLYYAGPKAFGDSFHAMLGHRLESYVGRQLAQISGATVHPEIVYDRGIKKTIDWFVILPQAVLLIEVKSARLNALALAGDEDAISAASERYLQKARQQIDTTAALLEANGAEVRHIPKDRQMIGIVVTAEPFYMANSLMEPYGQPANTPSVVASLAEVEALVTLSAYDIGRRLLEIINDSERITWNLAQAIGERPDIRHNAILMEADGRMEFLREMRQRP